MGFFSLYVGMAQNWVVTYLLKLRLKEQIWWHVILDDLTSNNIVSKDTEIQQKSYIKNTIKNI